MCSSIVYVSRFHFHDLIVFKVKIAPLFKWFYINYEDDPRKQELRQLENVFARNLFS